MGLIKSKEEKKQAKEEQRQKKLNEFIDGADLQLLRDKDKDFTYNIKEYLENSQGYGLLSSIEGSEAEIAQLEATNALIEQNWVIIKLLNEINEKIDW